MKAELVVYANQDLLEYTQIVECLMGDIEVQHVLCKGMLVRVGHRNGVVVRKTNEEVEVMLREGGKHYTFKFNNLRLLFA